MKFHNRHRRNIKRYRKTIAHEYAIIFDSSNSLVEYICSIKTTNIINSSLYTRYDCYQLIICANNTQNLCKKIVFKDKLHIEEIKLKSRLICKNNAVQKMQKAFKGS